MLVIAHRGASGHAPENTMAAFRKAVAQGATFIETDLQLSRDAHFVAIHDGTVNRTTNGRGSVHDLTLVELRELDAGSWFGSEFSGERIPTLEEILQFSKKNDVVFYLEMKTSGAGRPGYACPTGAGAQEGFAGCLLDHQSAGAHAPADRSRRSGNHERLSRSGGGGTEERIRNSFVTARNRKAPRALLLPLTKTQ